jgi:hypothetical protein
LEPVSSLADDERRSLLDRPAPISARLKFLAEAGRGLFVGHDCDRQRHQFTMPLTASGY